MAKEPKKFGLIIPKSKQNLVVGSRLKPSFFDDDDELEHDKKEKKEKQSVGADKVKRHVQNQLQKALEEDPTAFQYDEVYDKIEDERTKVVETKKAKEKREPKYVTNLLKTAEKRQQEYEAREERKQMAEREKEAGEFDDREVFVTSTYRKKMEELQSYKEEERRKEQLESMMDVTKQKDMSGFYKHFLNDMTAGQSTAHADEKTASENKNDKEHSIDQLKSKKQKAFHPRERRSSSSSDDDVDRQVHQKSAHKSSASTIKRRRSKSASSDEERKAFEEIASKHSRRKSSHSNTKVETEIQKKRRFFTPSPSPERTNGRRKSGEKSARTTGDRRSDEKSRRNDTKSSRSDEKSSRKRSESSQKRKDEPKSSPEKKEKTPEIVSPVVEKKFVSEKEEKENKLKERLTKMKILFSRRNDDASINEYRRRYFERKEARKNA